MLPDPMARLSHLDARGRVRMAAATLRLLRAGRTPKGNVLATAHLAAVMAAKRTGEWIPLAHPLRVEAVEVTFTLEPRRPGVAIEARVRSTGRTGVEMEALTAVAAAALTLVDMLKAVDRTLVVQEIAVWEKRGGRSGDWQRPAAVARTARPAAAPVRARARVPGAATRRPARRRATPRASRRGR